MDKNPDHRAHIGQREAYFIRQKDGNKYLTKDGKWVIEGTVDKSEWHIPQSMFDELVPYMDF